MNLRDAKIKDVSTDGGLLTIRFSDGRTLGLPLAWYPSLEDAPAAERSAWRTGGPGDGIHWPGLDYDLDIEGLLNGRKEMPGLLPYTRWFRAQGPRRRHATYTEWLATRGKRKVAMQPAAS